MPRRPAKPRVLTEKQQLAEDRAEVIQQLKAHRDITAVIARAETLGITITDIAAHAGLSRETVYNHLASVRAAHSTDTPEEGQ